jgi:hypothetical protein
MPGRVWRYGIVAGLAFLVGSATIVTAATTGLSIGSMFFISMLNGIATTPCSSYTGLDGKTTTTCIAVVNAKGELTTKDADVRAALDKMTFGTDGSLKVSGTSTVTGNVNVTVTGGHINVDNLPTATSGGVTAIPLLAQSVVASGGADWWGVNVSSCRSFTVLVNSTETPPEVSVFVDTGSFPMKVDVKTKNGTVPWSPHGGAQWAFPVQPFSEQPLYAMSVEITARSSAPSPAILSGTILCQH